MLALLSLSFGGVAFAVGAATGRRTLANAVGGGLAVVTFIVHAIGPSVEWLRPLRPFHPSAGTRTPICSGVASTCGTWRCWPASPSCPSPSYVAFEASRPRQLSFTRRTACTRAPRAATATRPPMPPRPRAPGRRRTEACDLDAERHTVRRATGGTDRAGWPVMFAACVLYADAGVSVPVVAGRAAVGEEALDTHRRRDEHGVRAEELVERLREREPATTRGEVVVRGDRAAVSSAPRRYGVRSSARSSTSRPSHVSPPRPPW